MKELLLIRHAKSSWDSLALSDHDRPLNERGERDAPRIAKALHKRRLFPQEIVTSTALRAKTTALFLANGLGFSSEKIQEQESLYHAPAADILRVVQSLDESSNRVFLFGHNPGMHEAVVRLCRDNSVFEFPTLATAHIRFDLEFWGEVEWGSGILLDLLTPKSLPPD